MPKKQTEFIGIKMDKVFLITLDVQAESKGMNRSEFIKYCIMKEIEIIKTEQDSASKLTDFDRLMETILAINSTAIKTADATLATRQIIVKGIVQIQKAIVAAFPNNKKIEDIIYGEEK